MPPSQSLGSVLNDDEEAGRMAAQRAATILHGKGLIAIVGADPDVSGILRRARSFERAVSEGYPQMQVAAMGPGAFNAAEAQQSFLTILSQNPSLQCVVGLTTVSTRAVYSVLKENKRLGKVKLIGFDQDAQIIKAVHDGELDSLVAENMYEMGAAAVQEIQRKWNGQKVQPKLLMRPVMITEQNVNSPELRAVTTLDWFALP
jgi:ribose transport system substrate-binding protein